MPEVPYYIRLEAKKELARRYFWDFEKALYPEIFREDRWLLKNIAETFQNFVDNSQKHFLVISLPPGFFKSFTGKNAVGWLLGRDKTNRVISVSNAHDLAETFSSQIRDTILGQQVGRGGIAYPDIFPDTRVADGYATKSKWQLAGASEPSYRATSPTSAITGARANYIIIDDIIRNALDALNETVLDSHWQYFRNTLFTRTDEDNYKFIIIMQRWAKNDLAGRIIEFYGDDVEVVNYRVTDDSGKIIDETILSYEKLEMMRKTLSPEIFAANYMQEPIDIKGRLFSDIQTYETLPENSVPTMAYIDTADTGTDYFAGMAYKFIDGKVYILPKIVFTQEPAEVTEEETADMLIDQDVNEAIFESNNGGRMFARNIERIMKERGHHKTVVDWKPTTANKEARILANSALVQHNILMPQGWKEMYPELATQILSYVKGGKNKHDDGLDVLTAIAEQNTEPVTEYLPADELL